MKSNLHTLILALLVPIAAYAIDSNWLRIEFTPTSPALIGHHTTVRSITFTGLQRTQPLLVQRELLHAPGLQLDTNTLRIEQSRLEGLTAFGSVAPRITTSDAYSDINWQVTELPPLLPVGTLSSDNRNRLSFGASLYFLNFLGRGATLSFGGNQGSSKALSARYEDPWITGNHVSLIAEASYSERENAYPAYQETARDYSLWLGRYWFENGRIKAGAGYLHLNSQPHRAGLLPVRKDQLLWLSAGIGWDRKNHPLYPTSGNKLDWKERWYTGDAHFTSQTLDLRSWYPLSQRHLIYIATSQWLQIRNDRASGNMPYNFLLTEGGSATVRGLEATEQTAQFGMNEYLSTMEIRWRILPSIVIHSYNMSIPTGLEIALFGDCGSAWNGAISNSHRMFGGGIGIRSFVPSLQEARIDYAWSEGGNSTISFGIGVKADQLPYRVR